MGKSGRAFFPTNLLVNLVLDHWKCWVADREVLSRELSVIICVICERRIFGLQKGKAPDQLHLRITLLPTNFGRKELGIHTVVKSPFGAVLVGALFYQLKILPAQYREQLATCP